jgi:hypothetical protein
MVLNFIRKWPPVAFVHRKGRGNGAQETTGTYSWHQPRTRGGLHLAAQTGSQKMSRGGRRRFRLGPRYAKLSTTYTNKKGQLSNELSGDLNTHSTSSTPSTPSHLTSSFTQQPCTLGSERGTQGSNKNELGVLPHTQERARTSLATNYHQLEIVGATPKNWRWKSPKP